MNTSGGICPFQLAAHKVTSGNQAYTRFFTRHVTRLLLMFQAHGIKTHKVIQEFILDKLYLLLCPWEKVWRWCGSLKFCSNFLFIFLCFCRNWSIVIWMFYHFVAGQSVVVAASISEWSALHTLINNSWSFYMLVRRLPEWAVLGQNKLQYAVDLNEWMSEWCIYIAL